MIWLLGLFYSFHIAQSSLPSFEEVKARTRWCLGEGKHCSVNLLQGFDFSLCCAPYECTTIVKDRKPNWLLSSQYEEHRCAIPSTSTTNTASGIDETYSAKKLKKDDQVLKNKSIAKVDTEEYELASSESESSKQEEVQSIDSKNNSSESQSSYYSEENDVQNMVKRSTGSGMSGDSDVNFTTVKVNKTMQSLDQINSIGNLSEVTRISLTPPNSPENFMDVASNETESFEYSLLTNHSSELSSNFSNVTLASINNQYLKNISVNATFNDTNSEILSEEDWHSSQMQYDTRPMLRKVVTILPFHFFDSVKVTRINESIETSAE